MLQYEEQKSRLTALENDIKELGDALGLDYLKKQVEDLECRLLLPISGTTLKRRRLFSRKQAS